MHMNRFKTLFAVSVLAFSANAWAQETVIGIANIGPHPALQQGINGFKKELAAQGYVEGKNTKFIYGDASFTPSMIPQMLSTIEAAKPALILTMTTPVSQAALSSVKNKTLPMVFLYASQPVEAGLVPSWERGSDRFTGVTGANDSEITLAFAKEIFPEAKKFGVMYAPGESNDIVAIREMEVAAKKLGLEMIKVGLDSPSEANQRAQMLSGVDFFYALASNNIQSAIPAIASVTDRYKIPILSEETELIKKGMVSVAYAASYGSSGEHAGAMAAEILKGKKPSELAPLKPSLEDYTPLISRKRFAELGRTIPDSFKDCACFIDD